MSNSQLRRRPLCAALAASSLLLFACPAQDKDTGDDKASAPAPAARSAAPDNSITKADLAAFAALPASFDSKDNAPTDAKIQLGRMLYFEARLSKNHDISCNSCHQLDKFGVDGEATSPGHKKARGDRNSPTVYNAAGHFAQFWDGRAKDVEEQATGPVMNPVEMAMPDEQRVIDTLKSMPEYVAAFQKAFPEAKGEITLKRVGQAIGAFERKLVTPSRWDAFIGGKKDALNDAEKAGFKAFVASGCTACHNGATIGGTLYQKLGLVKPWPSQKDQGRFAVTKQEADKMMFKVPSLRNIAKTGPYFHDGGTKTLPEAVKLMARHQLGRELDAATVKSIVAWLETLTGEVADKALIAKPTLPPSTDSTPKPDPT